MAASCIMKQLREKHVSSEISKCLWSPKMDLIAIANVQGQVCLHRMSWQQVWVLNPPTENEKVTALAWRPDSNVLAIGYSSGKVLLTNIEDSKTIHELDLKEEVSFLSWNKYTNLDGVSGTKQETQENDNSVCYLNYYGYAPNVRLLYKYHFAVIVYIISILYKYFNFQDPWTPYAYPLPPLGKTFGETGTQNHDDMWQEPRLLQDQNDLNVLSIGTVFCVLHLYAYGLFHITTVNIKETYPSAKRIVNISPSSMLNFFSVIFERENNSDSERLLTQVTINTSVISSRHKELRSLAQKYGQIHSLMAYIGHTLTLIEDAWESTLIEMDSKLASYAASVPEGGVSADFLDLLTFGHCSAEFEIFLTNKLSEKNLKKLRLSIEICYSMMQRLVVKHLQQVSITLVFILSQIEGMSKRENEYGTLGVKTSEVTKAMSCVGSFLLKSSEMLQAIESSMRDFRIFVRWISSVHLRLLREHLPLEVTRMSQQDITNLLNFLNDSFEEVVTGPDGEKRTHFRLEKAGQYLKKEELKCLPNYDSTPFSKLLKSNPTLASHRLIFTHNPKTSLMQEHEYLTESLKAMGAQPSISISASVELGPCISVSRIVPGKSYALSQIASQDGSVLGAFVPAIRQSQLFLLEWCSVSSELKSGDFYVSGTEMSGGMQFGMMDTQFYSSEVLSLLLFDKTSPRNPSFAQTLVQHLRAELTVVPVNFDKLRAGNARSTLKICEKNTLFITGLQKLGKKNSSNHVLEISLEVMVLYTVYNDQVFMNVDIIPQILVGLWYACMAYVTTNRISVNSGSNPREKLCNRMYHQLANLTDYSLIDRLLDLNGMWFILLYQFMQESKLVSSTFKFFDELTFGIRKKINQRKLAK
ncbi:Anaphase-promoting complex subunit 4 [Armadillidium nasatum]|uniref:Anaphase-promoting complex subunit 4 n=1 Tax=Armadillidium nasatum TaxID=96803 RepID=A0A5N5SIU6_9CRUS|nr:Anaphase-promoting complex subunit 4 [Armadillidium nasatum]